MSRISRLLGTTAAANLNILDEKEAARLLRQGLLPPNSVVEGTILRYSNEGIQEIPPGLIADGLNLDESHAKLNPGLRLRRLTLNQAKLPDGLPNDLQCEQLDALGSDLREIPDGVVVSQRLNLSNCSQLVRLPDGLRTNSLVLRNCTSLEALPEGLSVYSLDISGCTRLRALPARGAIPYGQLRARDCVNLEPLPGWLENLSVLDLHNCSRINHLPPKLRISEWIDIGGSGITSLPPHMDHVGLRWRGVPVSRQIVFQPETLTSNDILKEFNAEVRRVMLERVGFERFLELAKATTLDSDRDKGGERKLLKVSLMPSDENLVCVSFNCPSTGRKYVVRVPPTISSARAAVAWIAGFDNPDDYKPVMES